LCSPILAALLHCSRAADVSQTLQHLAVGATYIWQGSRHIGPHSSCIYDLYDIIHAVQLFSDDGDSGSGEASGDDMSGSGEDSEAATVNDLWHFVSFTTTVPASGVAKQGSMLFFMCVVIVCLAVISVVGPVFYC